MFETNSSSSALDTRYFSFIAYESHMMSGGRRHKCALTHLILLLPLLLLLFQALYLALEVVRPYVCLAQPVNVSSS